MTYYSDRIERIEDCKEKNMVDWRLIGVRNSTVIRDNAIRRSERNDWYVCMYIGQCLYLVISELVE